VVDLRLTEWNIAKLLRNIAKLLKGTQAGEHVKLEAQSRLDLVSGHV